MIPSIVSVSGSPEPKMHSTHVALPISCRPRLSVPIQVCLREFLVVSFIVVMACLFPACIRIPGTNRCAGRGRKRGGWNPTKREHARDRTFRIR